jgi:hypothetical protein
VPQPVASGTAPRADRGRTCHPAAASTGRAETVTQAAARSSESAVRPGTASIPFLQLNNAQMIRHMCHGSPSAIHGTPIYMRRSLGVRIRRISSCPCQHQLAANLLKNVPNSDLTGRLGIARRPAATPGVSGHMSGWLGALREPRRLRVRWPGLPRISFSRGKDGGVVRVSCTAAGPESPERFLRWARRRRRCEQIRMRPHIM